MTEWTLFGAEWLLLSTGLYFLTAWALKPVVRLVGDHRRRRGLAGPMRGPRLVRYETALRIALLTLGVGLALAAPWAKPVHWFWDVPLGLSAMGFSTLIHHTAKSIIPAAVAARLGLTTPLREPEAAPDPTRSSLGDIDTLGS